MKGLLKEKSEIEKLKRDYQIFTELNFNPEKTTVTAILTTEESITKECEL
jgi:hypothetical protein